MQSVVQGELFQAGDNVKINTNATLHAGGAYVDRAQKSMQNSPKKPLKHLNLSHKISHLIPMMRKPQKAKNLAVGHLKRQVFHSEFAAVHLLQAGCFDAVAGHTVLGPLFPPLS
ncbi:MAG: hypothetical protein HC828_08250 [Blastochloris sp.]|nr:hypothetical protein [Blastochloris sp.]